MAGNTMKLLTAVAVVLLWVGLARPGPGDDPKVAAARAGVRRLTLACGTYKVNHGEWPGTLKQLTQGPAPILKADALKDPWGKPYRYDPAGKRNGGLRPDVWTVTPDKQRIGNWQETSKPSPPVREPALRQELLRMVEEDQAPRMKIDPTGKPDAGLLKKMAATDRKNTARMKAIVDKYGWPGKSLVGEDGANAAWLLVQHADLDRDFQKRCLRLLKQAVGKGEASAGELAYLTDRVLVGDKKKQLYGTQFTFTVKNGEFVPYPIEDEAHVDQRRKKMGLGPLAEYKKQLRKLYQPPAPKK